MVLAERVPNALTIGAHAWMRQLGLESRCVAQLRKLRLGECLWIGYFDGPGATPEVPGHCEAYIERARGTWRFAAVWTLTWTPESPDAHVITHGEFQLLPGNLIRFASERDRNAEHSFRLVCRYVDLIYRHAPEYGIENARECLWHGLITLQDGCTVYGLEGPTARGLRAIIPETAMATVVVDDHEQPLSTH